MLNSFKAGEARGTLVNLPAFVLITLLYCIHIVEFIVYVKKPQQIWSYRFSACVICIDDLVATNKAVAALKNQFPSLPLIVRAKNRQHQKRLETTYGAG